MRAVLVYITGLVSLFGGIFMVMKSPQLLTPGIMLVCTGNVMWGIGILVSAVEDKD